MSRIAIIKIIKAPHWTVPFPFISINAPYYE